MNPASSITELVSILAASIAPVIVISGVGLLLLSMTNRYSRVLDRTRELVREAAAVSEPGRGEMIRQELHILYRRARMLRSAIISSSVSILFVALTVFAVFAAQIFRVRADSVAIPCFGLCLVALVISLYFFIRDVVISLTALELEISPYMKRS